jgi:hypothetical protein
VTVNRMRKRLLGWSVWLYTRPWLWILWLAVVIALVALVALVVESCRQRGSAFYQCGFGA